MGFGGILTWKIFLLIFIFSALCSCQSESKLGKNGGKVGTRVKNVDGDLSKEEDGENKGVEDVDDEEDDGEDDVDYEEDDGEDDSDDSDSDEEVVDVNSVDVDDESNLIQTGRCAAVIGAFFLDLHSVTFLHVDSETQGSFYLFDSCDGFIDTDFYQCRGYPVCHVYINENLNVTLIEGIGVMDTAAFLLVANDGDILMQSSEESSEEDEGLNTQNDFNFHNTSEVISVPRESVVIEGNNTGRNTSRESVVIEGNNTGRNTFLTLENETNTVDNIPEKNHSEPHEFSHQHTNTSMSKVTYSDTTVVAEEWRPRRAVEENDGADVAENSNVEEAKRIALRYEIDKTGDRYVYIFLHCEPSNQNAGLFFNHRSSSDDLYFDVFHKCCCLGVCSSAASQVSTQTVHGVNGLWIVLFINIVIVLTGIVIGYSCRFNSGTLVTTSQYSALPAIHSSTTSKIPLNTMSSLDVHHKDGLLLKQPARRPDQLEYSSHQLQTSMRVPLLQNCRILAATLDLGQRLGGGLFGDTYIAEWKERMVAAKRFTIGVHQNQLTRADEEWLLKQVSVLSRLRHKNIVAMLGICLDLRQPHIVTEFVAESRTLAAILEQEFDSLTPTRRVKLLLQVCEGITYLHGQSKPVLHRDLRCANVMVGSEDKVKVGDFGVTHLVQRLRNNCIGRKNCYCQRARSGLPASIRWTAPEILQHPTSSEDLSSIMAPPVDVFSFGMVMWEAAAGWVPFFNIHDEQEVESLILEGIRPAFQDMDGITNLYIDVMTHSWDQLPSNRPSMKTIFNIMKNVVQVTIKAEKGHKLLHDSHGMSYLKSALSIHIDN